MPQLSYVLRIVRVFTRTAENILRISIYVCVSVCVRVLARYMDAVRLQRFLSASVSTAHNGFSDNMAPSLRTL